MRAKVSATSTNTDVGMRAAAEKPVGWRKERLAWKERADGRWDRKQKTYSVSQVPKVCFGSTTSSKAFLVGLPFSFLTAGSAESRCRLADILLRFSIVADWVLADGVGETVGRVLLCCLGTGRQTKFDEERKEQEKNGMESIGFWRLVQKGKVVASDAGDWYP